MGEKGGPFELHPTVKQAMEQASGGIDQYFDFLKKNLGSIPTGGTELSEKLKEYTDQNITSVQEFLKNLSGAKDFQDVLRLQTQFVHSQLNAIGEQAKGIAEAYTKSTIVAEGAGRVTLELFNSVEGDFDVFDRTYLLAGTAYRRGSYLLRTFASSGCPNCWELASGFLGGGGN